MRGGVNPISMVKQAQDGTVYLIQLDGREEDWLEFINGQFTLTHHLVLDDHIWDGEQLDSDTFKSRINEFWEDSIALVDAAYFDIDRGNGLQTLTDTQETIQQLQELAE